MDGGIVKRLMIIGISALLLAGCGHRQVEYVPSPSPVMTREQAVDIVEQAFYEDFSSGKPQSVVVTEKFISLSDGILSKGSSVATAAPIGAGALVVGDSTVRTREVGQRLYFSSIGKVDVFQHKVRSGRFAAIVRGKDGSSLRTLRMRSIDSAKRFADAMEYLRLHSS